MEKVANPAEKTGRFFALPSTIWGRWSSWLFVASFVLTVLNTALFLPLAERRPGFDLLIKIVVLILAGGITAGGLTGIVGVARARERSWLVFLAIAMFVVAAAFLGTDLISPE